MNRVRAGAIVLHVHWTLLSVALVIAFAAGASGQQKLNVVVENVSFPNLPVEITGLEVAGTPHYFLEHPQFKFTASFEAPEDWLRRLAFRVKNKTDKTILAIKLQGSLATGAEGEVPMASDVRFGRELDESAFTGRAPRGEPRHLPPGETSEMGWTEAEYGDLAKFLAMKHPVVSYRRMYVELNEVRFDDGTVWAQHRLYRIDPRDPRKWTPLDGQTNESDHSPPLNKEAGEKVIVINPSPPQLGEDILEVVDIKVGGQSITPGQPFTADENWLRNLSVRIKNISAKSIAFAQLHFGLPEAKHGAAIMSFPLRFGKQSNAGREAGDVKPLIPGGEAELKLTDAEYERNRKFASERSGVTSFSRLRMGFASVVFEDGTRGSTFKLFRKQNAPGQNGAKK